MKEDDPISLGVTLHEINAALARETRRRVRKRLVAIGALLTGQSIQRAAVTAKTTPKRVECWLQRVRQSGFPSLLCDWRRRACKRELTPADKHETQRAIAAALQRPLRHQIRTRLAAIDMVLSGRPIEEATASARVLSNTVRAWVRLFARLGIEQLLAKWEGLDRLRPPQIDADPAALRELAAKERRQPRRKQMLALALVAEGMSPHAAALAAGANYASVLKRMRRFQKEGISAFHDKERWARKLTPGQIHELRAEILERPGIDYPQLRELVEARFGVRYALQSLRLLLKRDLGIVRENGSFIEVAAVRSVAADIKIELAPPVVQLHQPSTRLTNTCP
jgi:transposase